MLVFVIVKSLLEMSDFFEMQKGVKHNHRVDSALTPYDEYVRLSLIFLSFDFWDRDEQLLHYKIHNKLQVDMNHDNYLYPSLDSDIDFIDDLLESTI